MKKRIFTKMVCFILTLVFALPAAAFAQDSFILTDPVENTYTGRPQANRLIAQLQFTDLPESPALRDAIIRGGALEIIRPGESQFRPTAAVTREEAIAYALRAAGLSGQAMTLGQGQAGELPGAGLGTVWSMGYLQLARDIGLITAADFTEAQADALAGAPEDEDDSPFAFPGAAAPEAPAAFQRTEPATREEIADWIVGAFTHVESEIFAGETAGLSLQSFTDWNAVSPERASAVETLLRHNVISGQTPAVFGPQTAVTRQEMAQILRNLDSLLFELRGFERVTGTVAAERVEYRSETAAGTMFRHVYVRRADGLVDVLRFSTSGGPSPQDGPLDAVVLRGGFVMGLNSLQEGDQVEYIVHPETGTVWYVLVPGDAPVQNFRGRLQTINFDDGTMTFTDAADTVFTFPMVHGLYVTDESGRQFIRFGNELRPADLLPRGSLYDVSLIGNIITEIEFVGDPVVAPEIRGIVIDNNPMFGTLTILDQNRAERSFSYNPAQLVVQRREFFDMRDTTGGIHEMFPGFNPRIADISSIIPGDIVVFRVADDDPFRIVSISAAENTQTRYGRIREFRDQGGFYDMMMEFENGQTSWFTFVDGILVMSHGRPIHPNQIQLGDWARIVVNQAVLAPGVMMETVREIALDSGGHHINSIVMGRLAGFNASQNLLSVQHAQTLTHAGWGNHQALASFNVGGPNARFFHDGRPVTLAHINRYLQRSEATVYLAVENHFAGERAVVVSVRSNRDELLSPDHVLGANQNQFQLLGIGGTIQTDPGTIVVRNGRLVDQGHIFAPDWARVSLNGHNTAAIVNITPPPATYGVQIIRGRVARVWPTQSFRAESISLFDGFNWNFTPIAREFTIDHDTLFITGGGVTSIDDFLDFGDGSVRGDVFNIIVDGARAVRVVDAPFTQPIPVLAASPGDLTMRGIIYAIDGDTISLRDMTVYNARTGRWDRISNVNPIGTVTTHPNTIIVDRNQVIPANRLQIGMQIMALSDVPRNPANIAAGMSADAYIILVEN